MMLIRSERMNEMTQQAQKALSFNASLLSVYNTYISEVADYLSLLLNAEHNMIPYHPPPYHPVFVILNGILVLMFLNCVTTNRIVKNSQRLYFEGFPDRNNPGQWDFLLKQPYEFILTQSFILSHQQNPEEYRFTVKQTTIS